MRPLGTLLGAAAASRIDEPGTHGSRLLQLELPLSTIVLFGEF
jgi:hypothetical protein